jgi:hypothetical protein
MALLSSDGGERYMLVSAMIFWRLLYRIMFTTIVFRPCGSD